MKCKVKLYFEKSFKADEEKPTLELAATDDEPNVSTILAGEMTIPKDMAYEILRAAKEENKKPLMILEIVD